MDNNFSGEKRPVDKESGTEKVPYQEYQHDYYLRHREELLPIHRIASRNSYNRKHHPGLLPELLPERRTTARASTTLTRYAEPMSCRGDSCIDCGEIIEVYSQSGYCRDCWHHRRLMSRPTAPGRKCWNCGNQEMKIYKTNKGKCFLKCPNCGATDNEKGISQ